MARIVGNSKCIYSRAHGKYRLRHLQAHCTGIMQSFQINLVMSLDTLYISVFEEGLLSVIAGPSSTRGLQPSPFLPPSCPPSSLPSSCFLPHFHPFFPLLANLLSPCKLQPPCLLVPHFAFLPPLLHACFTPLFPCFPPLVPPTPPFPPPLLPPSSLRSLLPPPLPLPSSPPFSSSLLPPFLSLPPSPPFSPPLPTCLRANTSTPLNLTAPASHEAPRLHILTAVHTTPSFPGILLNVHLQPS